MSNFLKRFIRNQSGATAIEYTMLAALISVVIIVAAQTTGGNLTQRFATVTAGTATTP